jgi:hypothetical protein
VEGERGEILEVGLIGFRASPGLLGPGGALIYRAEKKKNGREGATDDVRGSGLFT